jgi:uncharacterized NAD(P)/FAD-binding protein YdhS
MQRLQNEIVVDTQIPQSAQGFSSANSTCDLAIVGAGISCAYTLIHYISLLAEKRASTEEKEHQPPIKVVVFDKSGEFWTGIPYGSRSGQQSLIITSLKEFLPQPECDRFIDWLRANYNCVVSSLQARPGILNSQWLKSYQQAMEQNNWSQIFVPRYLFGWYLKERVASLLEQAAAQNYLQCQLIQADVSKIQKYSTAYQINTTESNCFLATKVVLAIGSPPNKAAFLSQLESLKRSPSRDQVFSIADMYEPSQDHNLKLILKRLQADSSQAKQILIIGSNASALETIYSLNNLPEVAKLIDKFVVISPSGAFPVSQTFVAENLDLLIQQSDFTAQQIYQAVQQDVAAALANNETIDGTYTIISQKVIKALNQLSYPEQKQFVIEYGVKIGKFQRRAGLDYLNVADKLMFEGKLEFIQGKFTAIIPLAKNQFGFKFVTSSSQTETFTTPIQVVINCAGFQDLTQSFSPLINNLIQQGICTPNDSHAGFEMNENFEAQQSFYLMGPLVAGNINDKLKVWHAESCGRIFNLSHSLAEVLL